MEIRYRKNKASKFSKSVVIVILAFVASCALVLRLLFRDSDYSIYTVDDPYRAIDVGRNKNNGRDIPVFFPVHKNAKGEIGMASIAEKLIQDLQNSASVSEAIPLDPDYPPPFLESCGNKGIAIVAAEDVSSGLSAAQERFTLLKNSRQPHLAMELLKYCALEYYQGGLFLDSQSTLSSTLDHILTKLTENSGRNLAILNDPKISPDSIHGTLLYIDKASAKKKRKSKTVSVVEGMINVLLSTDVKVLQSSPLLLTKQLYGLIADDMGVAKLSSHSDAEWYLLQHTCNIFTLGQRQLTIPVADYALNSHR